MNKICKGSYIFINILLPICLGFLIYILYRSDNLRLYRWFADIGILNNPMLENQNFIKYYLDINLPSWVKFSLPGGLWIYAFTATMIFIWFTKINLFWLAIPICLGISLELMQLLDVCAGSYDSVDIIFLILGYILAIIISSNWGNKCSKIYFP